MARFHKGRDGQPHKCTAKPGKCPLGGEHFDSIEECEAAIERENAANSGSISLSKTTYIETHDSTKPTDDSELSSGKSREISSDYMPLDLSDDDYDKLDSYSGRQLFVPNEVITTMDRLRHGDLYNVTEINGVKFNGKGVATKNGRKYVTFSDADGNYLRLEKSASTQLHIKNLGPSKANEIATAMTDMREQHRDNLKRAEERFEKALDRDGVGSFDVEAVRQASEDTAYMVEEELSSGRAKNTYEAYQNVGRKLLKNGFDADDETTAQAKAATVVEALGQRATLDRLESDGHSGLKPVSEESDREVYEYVATVRANAESSLDASNRKITALKDSLRTSKPGAERNAMMLDLTEAMRASHRSMDIKRTCNNIVRAHDIIGSSWTHAAFSEIAGDSDFRSVDSAVDYTLSYSTSSIENNYRADSRKFKRQLLSAIGKQYI